MGVSRVFLKGQPSAAVTQQHLWIIGHVYLKAKPKYAAIFCPNEYLWQRESPSLVINIGI